MEKNILRKAIPIIGTISSGKSYFFDSLLGLNLLDSSNSVTTKFVCIIQHHPELKVPKFYNVEMVECGICENTKQMEYIGIPKGNIIVGHENIKEEIKKINKIEGNASEIKYEKLFYVLEIKVKNITNENLLNNYDFYDIPGLDEYIPDENKDKEKERNNSESKMKYVENLFKYFRSRIDFGVFIINSQSHYANSSKDIIKNVAKAIAPKEIKNYLIVLNKIDRQSEPETTIYKTKSIIVNNLLDKLNLADNTFVPLDSRELRNQPLMKENFENYLTYYFNKYVTQSVIPFKDNRKGNKEQEQFNTKHFSFLVFLLNECIYKGKRDDEKDNFYDELEEKFNDQYDFDELLPEFTKLFEDIKNTETFEINYEIDFEEDDTIKLFKALYICFKEKINIPEYSYNVQAIFGYFDNILKKLEELNEEPAPLLEFINQNFRKDFEDFAEKFKKFHDENKQFEVIKDLSDSIDSLYNYILNQQILYIGIFGTSSTGKSVIYNNIFGRDILTVNEKECTKRGIIIEDDENIALYMAKAIIKESRGTKFTIFERLRRIEVGEKNVKSTLTLFNEDYAKDTDMKDCDYFILTLPIKFFDEINLEPNLRKMIKFIDIPGYNTSNSDKFKYEPVIESISCFIMAFKAESLASEDNKSSSIIYNHLKMKSKRAVNSFSNNEFIKCCLFVINLWDKDSPTQENLIKWKEGIKKFVIREFSDKNLDFNLSYFNAKIAENYYNNERFFCDYQFLLDEIMNIYQNSNLLASIQRYVKNESFSDFFVKTLKNKFKACFGLKDKQIQVIKKSYSSEIYNEINLLFKYGVKNDDKKLQINLPEICSYLTYAKENMKKSIFYSNSYIQLFFNELKTRIEFSRDIINKDFRSHLLRCINIFNIFFDIDIEKHNHELKELFDKKAEEILKKLEDCLERYNYGEEYNKFISEIHAFFKKKRIHADEELEKNDNDLEETIKKIIEEFKIKAKNFQENFQNKVLSFLNELSQIYQLLSSILDLNDGLTPLDLTLSDAKMDSFGFSLFKGLGKVTLNAGSCLLLTAISCAFPPALIVSIPLAFFQGKNIFSALKETFSKVEKLKKALENLENNQVDEFYIAKIRFLRDINERIAQFKHDSNSLLGTKSMELTEKNDKTKEFYLDLKKDYIKLLKNMKEIFEINDEGNEYS